MLGKEVSRAVTPIRAKVIHMDSPPAFPPGQSEPVPILKRYETLLEVTGSLVFRMDLSELFRDLLQSLKEIGSFDFLNLVLHDPVRKVMRLNILEAQIPVKIPMSLELPIGDSPAGWVWQNQKPLFLRDLTDEDRFGPYARMLRESGIRTYYVFPLTAAERAYGAVSFGSRQANAYTDSDSKFMEQLATQIAVAVDVALAHKTARTYQEQLAEEHERLRLVHDITNTLVSHLDAKELFLQISKCIGRVVRHDYCSLCLYEPANDQIRIRAVDFPAGGDLLREDTVFPNEDSPAGRALATHNPLLINRLSIKNFPSKATQLLLDSGIRSGCWLPLSGRKRFLGTLNVSSFQDRKSTRLNSRH